jgi:hypothetical protein
MVVLVMICLVLFLGILFWPFLYNQLIFPLSQLLWILLRIFVLSVDQKYFWGGLIFAIIFLAFRRIAKQVSLVEIEEDFTAPRESFRDIEYWRGVFNLIDFEEQPIKSELVHLLAKVYASTHGVKADFHVIEEFKNGQIALPKSIRYFLFADESVYSKNPFKKLLQVIRQAVQSGFYRTTRRRKEAFYQSVCEVMSYLESSLENNDDNP